MKKSYDFFLPALAFGAALMVAGIIMWCESAALLAKGQRTEGVFAVVERRTIVPPQKGERGGKPQIVLSFHREVNFNAGNVEYHRELFYGPFPCRLNQGDRVGVVYLPADPWTSRGQVLSDLWGEGLVCFLPGLLLEIFGFIRMRRKRSLYPGPDKKYYAGW